MKKVSTIACYAVLGELYQQLRAAQSYGTKKQVKELKIQIKDMENNMRKHRKFIHPQSFMALTKK